MFAKMGEEKDKEMDKGEQDLIKEQLNYKKTVGTDNKDMERRMIEKNGRHDINEIKPSEMAMMHVYQRENLR